MEKDDVKLNLLNLAFGDGTPIKASRIQLRSATNE
jgi:hypothetical protein